MSGSSLRPARSAVVILGITAVVLAVVLGGGFAAWKIRKTVMIRQALTEGNAAFERGDWQTARTMLGRYIGAHPEDAVALERYARAQLAMRPLKPEYLQQAMGAYRQLLRAQPDDEAAFRRLARLYEVAGAASELEAIAAQRRTAHPNDLLATLTRAKALRMRERFVAAEHDELARALEAATTAGTTERDFVEACVLLSEPEPAAAAPTAASTTASQPATLAWLDRAVQQAPRSPLALTQRAAGRLEYANALERAGRAADQASELKQVARRDLEAADALATAEADVLLLGAEQWLIVGDFARAAERLNAARALTEANIVEFFPDPCDWTAALFVEGGKLALLNGKAEAGKQLVVTTLEQLADRPQRIRVLPLAIELLVRGNDVAAARQWLDTYLDAIKPLRNPPIGAEQLALLQAMVAAAENEPYRVIEFLEPVAERPSAPPLIRALLGEAYAATGQMGRVAKLFGEAGAGASEPGVARRLARAYLSQREWAKARDVLQAAGAGSANVESRILLASAQLGAALEQQDQPEQRAAALRSVAAELQELRSANPKRAELRVLLAAVADATGRRSDAEAELRQALAECDEPLLAVAPLAKLYADAGRLDDALELLRGACRDHGTQAAAWLALADLLASRQRGAEACTELERGLAVVTAPADKRRLELRLAREQLGGPDPAAGLAAVQKYAEANPEDTESRVLQLETPAVLQDAARAQRLVDELEQIEGKTGLLARLHQARIWLAGAAWRTHIKECEERLKYCINADPHWTEPALVLGGLYEQLRDWKSAEGVYASGFRASGAPELLDPWLKILADQKRFPEARDVLERASARLDKAVVANRRLELDWGQGHFDAAREALARRVKLGSGDPLDGVRLAEATYRGGGGATAALQQLDEAARRGAAPLPLARVRSAILLSEARAAQSAGDTDGAQRQTGAAEQALNELVAAQPTPEAYLLRAEFFTRTQQLSKAEQDYVEFSRVIADEIGPAMLGEFQAQQGQLDQAIATWEQGLQAFPNSTRLKSGLAKAFLTRGQPEDRQRAARYLNELAPQDTDDTELLWVRAVEQLRAATPDGRREAVNLLQRAAHSAGPARAAVYRGLAGLAFSLAQHETARDLLLRGLRENPEDTGLEVLLAHAEFQLGNLEAARAAVQKALAQGRNDVDAWRGFLEVADARRDQADLEQGLKGVSAVLAQDPNNETAQALQVRTLSVLGRADAARRALDGFRQTEAGGQNAGLALLASELARRAGDREGAGRELEVAAAREPNNPEVVHARLALWAQGGEFEKFAAALPDEVGPGREPALLVSAAALLSASPAHLDQAVQLCERAVKLAGDVPSYLMLANLLVQKGDAAGAEKAFREVLRQNPKQAEALNNLAWLLGNRAGAHDEALKLAHDAVALAPRDGNFRDTLAFILRKNGKLQEARDEYRRSVEFAADDAKVRVRALYSLAQVSRELNDATEAAEQARRALREDQETKVLRPQERQELQALSGA